MLKDVPDGRMSYRSLSKTINWCFYKKKNKKTLDLNIQKLWWNKVTILKRLFGIIPSSALKWIPWLEGESVKGYDWDQAYRSERNTDTGVERNT